MKATEMLQLVREVYRDKASLRQRHIAAARFVGDYNFNNTYQYVIAREDMHVRWLVDAIEDLGGQVEDVPAVTLNPAGKGEQLQRNVITADRDSAQAFCDKWRGRFDAMANARHRTMLGVVLGETAEHQRFFELALAGRGDLLGRRADGAGTPGEVMANRWVDPAKNADGIART